MDELGTLTMSAKELKRLEILGRVLERRLKGKQGLFGPTRKPEAPFFLAAQHDLDAERGEQIQPVVIGDHFWIAADVTVLRGVEIGEQSVVGTRSLVTRSMPPHTLALGVPAAPSGKIGDRSQVPI